MTDEELHGHLVGQEGSRQSMNTPAMVSANTPGLATVDAGAPHCDPTANLYDTYHVAQGDTLGALWPVSARGRSR